MNFRVDLRLVRKTLDRMEQVNRKRILQTVSVLETNPRPPKSRKIKGRDDVWRIRTGDYRILYAIADDQLMVLVLKVGHRREVYR